MMQEMVSNLNADKYKIPRNEIELTKRQLESYQRQLEEYRNGGK